VRGEMSGTGWTGLTAGRIIPLDIISHFAILSIREVQIQVVKSMTILRDNESKMVAESVKPDAKNRVVLPKKLVKHGITYKIYVNDHEQIILDPQVTIPLSELWVFENKDILDSIDRGMKQAANGETTDLGSFSQYADD